MSLTASAGSIIGGALRLIASLFGKERPKKLLKSRINMRGIVAELPSELPLKIVDPAGGEHKGVYAMNVLIWNKGSEAITPADFLDNSPLRVSIGMDSYIMMADFLSNDDQLNCSTDQVDEHNVDIYFDCINPGDHISIVLFYGGKSFADIQILGRIRGQATAIDHGAEEVQAGIGERILHACMLIFIFNMFVGFPISAWLIYSSYGFSELLKTQPNIPPAILVSFGLGLFLVFAYVTSRVGMWLERRKYPAGYPLHSDFEPPLWENVKGMLDTVCTGKKTRLSTSIFDWAKPVIVRKKNSRRLSANDWMT